MSKIPDIDSPEFLILNAANLFVPGGEEQITAAVKILAETGFHPIRHNIGARRIVRIAGENIISEGEFVAIADLGLTEEVEAKAQRCMQELGIDQANTQLIWANSSLQIFNIKGN